MSKTLNKTLTGAMATMMATGLVATPVMAATTDADALYKAAYTATMKAQSEKSQASVNEARAAINALKGTKAAFAVGTFSGMVDKVQDPILRNILNAIKKAETTPNQANINAAKKAIPAELTQIWKNSYSSAIDKIQQGLQVKALEAIKKAETDKTEEAVAAAKKLVADLLTSDSASMVAWAKTLDTKVDAIKIYDLDLTKVVSISRYEVEVEFETLKETLKDVSITVVDANGKTHEVYAKNLLKGSKKTTFELRKTAGVTELKGVWTVDDVEYDFAEIALVKEVKNNLSDADKLGAALVALQEEGYIDGLFGSYNRKDEFVFDTYGTEKVNETYRKALAALTAAKIVDSSDVQDVIDEVNAELDGDITVKSLIELAKDTKSTNKQVNNAMDDLGLEMLNSDWAGAYRDEIKVMPTSSKIEAIQKAVYAVNKTKIGTVPTTFKAGTMTSVEVKVAKENIEDLVELIELYHQEDTDKVKTKANALRDAERSLAFLDVKAVSDVTDLPQLLMQLSEVVNDAKVFSYENDVNENIMSDYEDIAKEAESIADLKADLAAAQATALAGKVAVINTAANANDLLTALKDKVAGLKNVKDDNKDAYFADVTVFAGVSSTTVQDTIDAVNARVELVQATTVASMTIALNDYFKATDKVKYDYSEAKKKDIAEELLVIKNGGIELEDIEELDDQIDAAVLAIKTKLDKINAALDITVGNEYTEVERAQLVTALTGVTGKTEAELDSLVSKFLEKSTTAAGGKVTYTTYTQVRTALGL